jgi:CheY-like chemotaxis protein
MRTVLLVESHGDTRDLYAEYLSSVGFRVKAEATADAASLRHEPVDAVIVGMDRHEIERQMTFVRMLRELPDTQDIAVLAVGTGAGEMDEKMARAAGCDIYLPKPCVPIDLARELRHAILLHRRPRRHDV